ncbi:MAG: hypothetical protein Q9181_000320 [Wetmoreana brouardii]
MSDLGRQVLKSLLPPEAPKREREVGKFRFHPATTMIDEIQVLKAKISRGFHRIFECMHQFAVRNRFCPRGDIALCQSLAFQTFSPAVGQCGILDADRNPPPFTQSYAIASTAHMK